MLCVLGSNRNERPRKLFEEGLCRGWITIEKPFKGERGGGGDLYKFEGWSGKNDFRTKEAFNSGSSL